MQRVPSCSKLRAVRVATVASAVCGRSGEVQAAREEVEVDNARADARAVLALQGLQVIPGHPGANGRAGVISNF